MHGSPAPTEYDGELVRVCQEAIANVDKHAAATRAEVRLDYSPSRVTLEVALLGQNLILFARLRGLGRRAAEDRSRELIGQFGLAEAEARVVREFFGDAAARPGGEHDRQTTGAVRR